MHTKLIKGFVSAVAVWVICAALPAANAEVVDADSHGFTIRIHTKVNAERMAAYKAAVEGVGSWWHGDHTISGYANNMYIDASVPGCFCENLGDGAGIVHMLVTYVSPGVVVRLTGGLGPLGLMGVEGNMTWEFDDSTEGTVVTLNYAVGGYYPDGLDSIAPAVDGVLAEAMTRLATFAETGSPEEQH